MQKTIVRIEGPPGGYKSLMAVVLQKWLQERSLSVYLEDENSNIKLGSKDEAQIEIYVKQVVL
jgi:thymidylate kinase